MRARIASDPDFISVVGFCIHDIKIDKIAIGHAAPAHGDAILPDFVDAQFKGTAREQCFHAELVVMIADDFPRREDIHADAVSRLRAEADEGVGMLAEGAGSVIPASGAGLDSQRVAIAIAQVGPADGDTFTPGVGDAQGQWQRRHRYCWRRRDGGGIGRLRGIGGLGSVRRFGGVGWRDGRRGDGCGARPAKGRFIGADIAAIALRALGEGLVVRQAELGLASVHRNAALQQGQMTGPAGDLADLELVCVERCAAAAAIADEVAAVSVFAPANAVAVLLATIAGDEVVF